MWRQSGGSASGWRRNLDHFLTVSLTAFLTFGGYHTGIMEYVLETSALTKRYRGFTALDSLTMRVPKGAIYGFVGRNGAGKTTLIRLICGLQEPTGGSFTLYGVRNTDARICRLHGHDGGGKPPPAVSCAGNALH